MKCRHALSKCVAVWRLLPWADAWRKEVRIDLNHQVAHRTADLLHLGEDQVLHRSGKIVVRERAVEHGDDKLIQRRTILLRRGTQTSMQVIRQP
jgi:hypothetical protein